LREILKMTKKLTQKTIKDAHAGRIFVSRTVGNNPSVDDDKLLEVQEFEVEPAFVRAGYGVTINLGNYESARCDVSVTLPCYKEEVKEAVEEAWGIAEEALEEQKRAAFQAREGARG
jgi:hypothetical protein